MESASKHSNASKLITKELVIWGEPKSGDRFLDKTLVIEDHFPTILLFF